MSNDSVVKLNFVGAEGQEMFLVVDFTTKDASVIAVFPNGNAVVTDVQPINRRGR